jgi:DNA-binding transcriptional LysR family regulator
MSFAYSPKMRELTLRQLRGVVAVYRTGKIVSAARQLGLSQPTITLQIRDAEQAAGLTLFDRTAEGMRPTAAGQAMVDAALAIEERLRVLGQELEAIKGGKRGLLRLGVVSTAKYFAPRIIAGFIREHPEIEISLWVGNRAETIESLRNRSVDVALMGRPPREVKVRAALFGEHPMVIIGAPGHPLAQARHILKTRIAEEQFLVREPGSGTRIALEVESGQLSVLDVEGMPIRRQWFLVSRADTRVTPLMAAFEDFLVREGPRFLPVVKGA